MRVRDPSLMRDAVAYASTPVHEFDAKPDDEAELLARLRRGDRAAAGEFYDRYAGRIRRFIMQTLGSTSTTQDAEDLMQETFIAMAEALPFFRGDSTMFTFTCAIAHRKAFSFMRTNARRARIAASAFAAGEPGVEDSGPDDGMRRALGQLKPDYRELLHLKYVEEATTAEIAAILRQTEHAVESRLKRARQALKKLLVGDQ